MGLPGGGTAWYRRLLVLLPRRFRERFGSDMEELLRHRLAQATTPLGARWVRVRAAVDVLVQAALVRMHEGDRDHDGRMGTGMGTVLQDLRYAVRALAGARLFAAVSIGTLALGIGASTATFSVAEAVLFKAPSYPEPDRLVAVWPARNFNIGMVQEAQAMSPALESISGISGWGLTLTGVGDPMTVDANRVSTSHFHVLGVAPALGRTFQPEDGLPGSAGVVILSHDFWVRVFGADPSVVGRTLDMAGADTDTRTVIGVMPAGFRPVVGRPEVWVPLTYDPATGMERDDSWFVNIRVARLAPGATLEQATEQMRAFAVRVHERMPRTLTEEGVATAGVEPLGRYLARSMGPVLWVTLGAVSLVLLIACANVANLLLARGEARARDLAVRSALGAGRGRMIRLLLAESASVGLVGGALGVALSYALVHLVVASAPADFPRIAEVAVDGPVLAYAFLVTILATLVAGLVPAVRASRVDAVVSLGGGRGTGGRRTSRLTTALVAAEIALAVVVAVGSGLMLRSLQRLMSVDPGLKADGVLVFRTNPPDARYGTFEASVAYNRQVLERVAALPDVASVGAIHLLPGTENNWNFPTWPEGVDVPEGTPAPMVNFRVVWPGYFRTVGIRLLQGRFLRPSDETGAERLAVVNETFVKRFWPGLDPLGRSLRTIPPGSAPFRVVGIVGDVHQRSLADPPEPEMYFTQTQSGRAVTFWVMARMRQPGSPLSHAAAIREAVWSVDRDVPVTGMQELAAVFKASAATTRFLTLLLSSFGSLALALGAIGVFGVTTYAVGRRVPEFGVRIALGSSRGHVLRSALRTCFTPVIVGLTVGLGAAAGSTRTLRASLFEVGPTDPVTFTLVGVTLLVVALGASLLPAWRASRVDPVRALNAE